jgi:hypothetical protein
MNWTYKSVTVPNAKAIIDQLNTDGAAGWECFRMLPHGNHGEMTWFYKKSFWVWLFWNHGPGGV